MSVPCSRCGRELAGPGGEGRVASISGGIMGDEYIESYYLCPACGVYTVEVYHDRFSGEDSVNFRGPVPKAEGDAQVALIAQCSEPWSKRCRCEAHRSYWGDFLD